MAMTNLNRLLLCFNWLKNNRQSLITITIQSAIVSVIMPLGLITLAIADWIAIDDYKKEHFPIGYD